MIDHYQPFLLPFLKTRMHKIPKGVRQYYYYSFEDGLWDLLEKKKIPKGSTVLVPDFYCMDVVSNIRSHGWRVEYYNVDDSFQISLSSFKKYVQKYNPMVIVIFHAVGITSALSLHLDWIASLRKNSIVIEDSVHRLVDPEKISIPRNNWFILDSVRKVSPLPGSFLYGKTDDMSFPQTKARFNIVYICSTVLLYIFFRFILIAGHVLSSSRLIYFAHKTVLAKHDNVIGDSSIPFRGLPGIPHIHRFLDFHAVSERKNTQVKLYESLLWPYASKIFFRIRIHIGDYPFLHAYPIGIYGKVPNNLRNTLTSKRMMIWEKFPDSPWSQSRSVLFLPLGFHIKDKDIKNICNTLIHISTW